MMENGFLIRQIVSELNGYTVVGAVKDSDDEFAGILFKKGTGEKVAWILADSEGNGPGWIDIKTLEGE